MSDTGRTHLFKIGLNDPFGYIHGVSIIADHLHIFRIRSNGVSKYRMAIPEDLPYSVPFDIPESDNSWIVGDRFL
jgi:hypothetical protein